MTGFEKPLDGAFLRAASADSGDGKVYRLRPKSDELSPGQFEKAEYMTWEARQAGLSDKLTWLKTEYNPAEKNDSNIHRLLTAMSAVGTAGAKAELSTEEQAAEIIKQIPERVSSETALIYASLGLLREVFSAVKDSKGLTEPQILQKLAVKYSASPAWQDPEKEFRILEALGFTDFLAGRMAGDRGRTTDAYLGELAQNLRLVVLSSFSEKRIEQLAEIAWQRHRKVAQAG